MKYQLFASGGGILVTRSSITINGELPLVFIGAPKGNVYVFVHRHGEKIVKTLDENGACAIPQSFLSGVIHIEAVLYVKNEPTQTWRCEPLLAAQTESGVFVTPCDMDLPARILALEVANEKLTLRLDASEKKLAEFVEQMEHKYIGFATE